MAPRDIAPAEPSHPGTVWLRVALGLAGLACFGALVARADVGAVREVISGLPAMALVVLLPFPLSLAADALAWTRLLRRVGARASFARAWLARVASEAVGNSVPMAGLASETVGPVLLARLTGVPLPKAFATSTAKRWLISRAHATYVVLCLLLLALGTRASLVPVPICAAVAVLLGVASALTQLIAGKAAPARKLFSALSRVPLVRRLVEGHGGAFGEVDADLGRLAGSLTVDAWALVVLAWLFEGTETWLLLWAAGLRISWTDAIALDGVLSALRSAALFVPSGLGVQDAGFAYLLGDESTAHATVFLLLKRGKELLYVGLGLGVYFLLQGRVAHAPKGAPA